MADDDLYEILQVSPDAEAEVIEAAYKRLMRKYHPDVNRDAAASSRARDINAAYEVLGDRDRRREYDETRQLGDPEENPEPETPPHVARGKGGPPRRQRGPSRAARRRKDRHAPDGPPPVWRRRQFINGAIVAAIGLATIVAAVVLLSGGGDDDGTTAAGETPEPVVFVPETAEDVEIDALARRTVEALPQGSWPDLYASFTQQYQDRCPQEDFEAAGQESANALGESLSRIRYVRLENVAFEGADMVTMVIVGEVTEQGEYTLAAEFEREDGAWRIAPASGTTGCNAFSRLSG